MKPETITALKFEMGYTEDPTPSCGKCRHSKEVDHPVLDREWVRLCTFNTIGAFTVANHGRCSRFEK